MKKNLLVLILLMIPCLVFGETVYLKSGKKVEGKIVDKGADYIKVDMGGMTLTYYQEDIDRVEGGDVKFDQPANLPATQSAYQPTDDLEEYGPELTDEPYVSDQPAVSTVADNDPVKQSFDKFRQALMNSDGRAAGQNVTRSTLDFYNKCRQAALTAYPQDLEKLMQAEVILIMQLRYLLEAAKMRAMDGLGVFSWGVESGLIDKDSLSDIELMSVDYNGAKATAEIGNAGGPGGGLNFYREDGVWKLDLMRLLTGLEPEFDSLRQESGKDKAGFALYSLEQTYGATIDPKIINGPLK